MEMTHGKPANQDGIIQDPQIMLGKPVVRGTRVPVELVLKYLAQDPDLENLFGAFPHLTLDDVKACLAYAQAAVEREWAQQAGREMTRAQTAHA
jgi:uncharacterized protein (DUF433 family)